MSPIGCRKALRIQKWILSVTGHGGVVPVAEQQEKQKQHPDGAAKHSHQGYRNVSDQCSSSSTPLRP